MADTAQDGADAASWSKKISRWRMDRPCMVGMWRDRRNRRRNWELYEAFVKPGERRCSMDHPMSVVNDPMQQLGKQCKISTVSQREAWHGS